MYISRYIVVIKCMSYSLCFLVFLREGYDSYAERHAACTQDIHHTEVLETDLEAELLQRARIPARRHLGLVFTGRAGARHPPRRPYRCRRIRPSQLHRHHSVLAAKFYVYTVQCDLSQIQVALNTKTAHNIVYQDVYFRSFLLVFGRGLHRHVLAGGDARLLRFLGLCCFTVLMVGHHMAGDTVS